MIAGVGGGKERNVHREWKIRSCGEKGVEGANIGNQTPMLETVEGEKK